MSGFEAWASTFPATLTVAACTLVLGMIAGWVWATRPGLSRRERRELADAAADRAARQFRRMRQPELAFPAPGARSSRSTNMRPKRTSTAAFLDPTPYGAVMFAAVAPEIMHEWEPKRSPITEEWEPAHVGAALAVANGGPIGTGEIRAITEDMDAFLEGLLAAHPVPYPDGGDQ